MNYLQKFQLPCAIFSAVLIASALPAHADEVVTPSSYIGAGATLGIGQDNTGTPIGGNVAGRYKFNNMPASLRTSVLFGGGGTTVVPTVSYDVPFGDRANVYLGAGASIPTSDSSTLLGNRTAFAIQPGVEVSLSKQVLLYGNAIISVNSYNSGATGAALQGGIGYQF